MATAEASAVPALHDACRSFGPQAARRKLALLRSIAGAERLSPGELVLLQDALGFMRAYPDNARLRRLAGALVAGLRERVARAGGEASRLRNSGLPGAAQSYPYHWGTLREMVGAAPGCLELDWDEGAGGSLSRYRGYRGGLLGSVYLARSPPPISKIEYSG